MTNEQDVEQNDSRAAQATGSRAAHAPDSRAAHEVSGTQDEHTIGSSSIYRLCEEIIALREINNRQHKMFEQTLAKTRDAVQTSFNSFAADTQRAYQQLRQEFHGEKRISLALLNALVEIAFVMQHIVSARPPHPSPPGGEGGVGGDTDPRAAHAVSSADQGAAHPV